VVITTAGEISAPMLRTCGGRLVVALPGDGWVSCPRCRRRFRT